MKLIRASKLLHRFGLDVTFHISPTTETFAFLVVSKGKLVYACDAKSGEVPDAIVRTLIRSYSEGIRNVQVHGDAAGRVFPEWVVFRLPYNGGEHSTSAEPRDDPVSSGG